MMTLVEGITPNDNIANFESCQFKFKITKRELLIMIIKNVEIAVSLTYLFFKKEFLFYHLKMVQIVQETQGILIPEVEIKDYNVMINGAKFFDQPVKNNSRT